jgi:hypothetical protein
MDPAIDTEPMGGFTWKLLIPFTGSRPVLVTGITVALGAFILAPTAALAQPHSRGNVFAADESPAGATLEGCEAQASSTDSDGQPLDTVTASADGSSQDDPFEVDYDGEVTYSGTSTAVIKNHSWEIDLFSAPIKTGGSDNAQGTRKAKGTVSVSDYLPFKVAGLYYVSGSLEGDGGTCAGNLWVKLTGSPIGTIPWIAGIALAGLGLLGMLTSRPTAVGVASPPKEVEVE